MPSTPTRFALSIALALGALAVPAPAGAQAPAAEALSYHFPSGLQPARRLELTLAPQPIPVWLPADLPTDKAVALLEQLAKYLGEVPVHHLSALLSVAFDPGEYPFNAQRADKLKQPELKLWASAKDGRIVFYRNDPPGDWRVTRRRVLHELGHCLALRRFGSSTPPAAWTEAALADGTFFTDYSRNAFRVTGSLVEDFADAYATYMQALTDGAAALARFEATYPARARLLASWVQPAD